MRKERKLKFYLNLEWIFDRLAHEKSFQAFTPDQHPARTYSTGFMLDEINESDAVLDLGCNLGDISNFIAQKAKKVVGIDHNPVAIETAGKRYVKSNLSFYHGEAYAYLKSTNEKFDVLILSHVLEHLDDPKDFLLQFSVFFKRVYIEVPDFDKTYLNHYRQKLGMKLIYTDDDHISEFDRKEIQELIKTCGLQIKSEEYRYGLQKFWCEVINA